MTIGDGVYVHDYPNGTSVITDELPARKVVYVTGQKYDADGQAWHVAQYDKEWGYIRGDMLRMMKQHEVLEHLEQASKTPEPAPTATPEPYSANSMSCYGYVSADSVNFRKQPTTQSERISRLKRYALCLIYDKQTVEGTLWYKIGYQGTIGYVNGDYFRQMTVAEAEDFFTSREYQEGLANNTSSSPTGAGQTSTGQQGSSGPQTTGTPSGIVSAEDQQVQTWQNPDTVAAVSYKPFDPFATPEPLPENDVKNREYLDSLVERIRNGALKEEDVQKLLETAYRDSADKDTVISSAMTYIREKLGTESTEQPTEAPEDIPLNTEENQQFEKEETEGGSAIGWIIGGLVLAGAGGGGYYYYATTQKKRQAAQRLAQKKAAQQRRAQSGTRPAGTNGTNTAQAPAAQQAAKVRTPGTHTGSGTGNSANAGNPYSKNVENPYARYTTGKEEDATYTASFKPQENKTSGNSRRRRNNSDIGDGDEL